MKILKYLIKICAPIHQYNIKKYLKKNKFYMGPGYMQLNSIYQCLYLEFLWVLIDTLGAYYITIQWHAVYVAVWYMQSCLTLPRWPY